MSPAPALLRLARKVAIGLAVLLVALLFGHQALVDLILVPWLEARLSDALELEVRIEALSIEPTGTVTVRGIRAHGPEPRTLVSSLECGRLTVRLAPLRLLDGGLPVAGVAVEDLDLALDLAHPSLGGRDAPEDKEVRAGGAVVLPPIDLRRARIVLEQRGRRLVFAGVSASLDPPGVALRVDAGGGDWDAPRLGALEFPLDATGRLAGEDVPWDRIAIDALDAGGKPLARDVVLELGGPEAIRFQGDLPGLGLVAVRGSVDGDTLEVGAHTDGADVRAVAAVFTDLALPRARATGPIRLVLPLDRIEGFLLDADVDLAGVFLEEPGIGASVIGARLLRGADGVLAADVLAVGLEGAGLPTTDAWGRLHWALSPDGSSSLWVEEITARLTAGRGKVLGDGLAEGPAEGLAEATLRAEVDLDRLAVRHGLLSVRGNPIAALELLDAAGREGGGTRDALLDAEATEIAPALEPRLEGRVAFHGAAADLATWAASGSLTARDLPGPEALSPLDASVSISLAGCRLAVSDARLEAPRTDIRLSLDAGLDGVLSETARIVVGDLHGSVECVPFAMLEPAVVDIAPEGFAAGPIDIAFPGGTLTAGIEAGFPGDLTAYVETSRARLDAIASTLEVPLGGRALATEAVGGAASLCALAALRAGDRFPEIDARLRVDAGRVALGAARLDGLEVDGALRSRGDVLIVDALEARRGDDFVRATAAVPIEALIGRRAVGDDGRGVGDDGRAVGDDGRGVGETHPAKTALDAQVDDVRVDFAARVEDLERLPIPRGTFRDIEGKVVAEGTLRIPPGALRGETPDGLTPRVAARVVLSGGALRFYGSTPSISDLEGTFDLDGQELRLRRLAGRTRGAAFTAAGLAQVALPWEEGFPAVREVDVAFETRNALLVRTDDVRARGDVRLRWRGPWDATRLEGRVDIVRAYYLQRIRLAPTDRVRLPLSLFSIDVPPFDSARLAIRVASDRGIIVKNNIASTRASADLLLAGTGRFPALAGYVSADEGTVRVGNATMRIASAFLDLSEADPLNPRIRIALTQRIRGYDANVLITGTMEEPEIVLSSNPPLPQDAIVVLVMTGMTPGEIDRKGADRVAATQAAMYFGRQVLDEFSTGDPTAESFLDDLTVETESAKREGYYDPLSVEYRVARDLTPAGDDVFLQGERDTYGDFNFHVGIRFQLE